MSEKINLKARSEAYKDAKSAVEKGAPEAVGAARRMINEEKIGQSEAEYHGNPETAGAKLEKEPKFVVLDNAKLKEIFGETLIGKPASEVMRLVKEKYGDKVPGLEQ